MKTRNIKLTVICFVWLLMAGNVLAQTTAFTYQGKLTEAGNPANGTYDMQFKLFDTATVGTGTQHGATLSRPTAAVANGSFTVELNFDVCATCFDGSARYLEIGVRPAGNPNPHTLLNPRVSITSTPYAMQTINTQQLGGLPASRYVKSEANGNVAIGTGTPAHRLAVLGGPAWTGDGWGGALELENSSAIAWRANTSNEKFGIGRTENGLFFFRTMSPLGTTTNAPIYDFKMDNNGNVGIGNIGISTDLSGAKLHMFTSGYGVVQTWGAVTVGSFVDSSAGWFGTKSNHPLFFFTNNGFARMTVATNGNVGIGTSNPTARLTVSGSGVYNAAGAPRFDLFNTTAGTGFLQHITDSGLWQIATTTGATRMVIDPSGNVGIGTSNPTSKVEIVAQDGLAITGFQPFLTLRDTNTNLRSLVAGGSGDLGFYPNSFIGTIPAVLIKDSTGNVGIGTTSPTAKLHVAGTAKTTVLEITGGADLAEHFEVVEEEVKPGMVVAIDAQHTGKLSLSRTAYNRRVAGIISGANNLSAGMVLPNVKEVKTTQPVALSGRVWVYCEATKNPIRPGDLLTTSNIAGHAMRVRNYTKAQGATIGKAMTELNSGRGLVLVLVSLQ